MEDIYLYNPITNKHCDYNVWLAFAGIESFALSSLGYLWLFKTIDEMHDVNVEKITSDTTKTKFMLSQVNLIGFSFSFDLDFPTIFNIYDKFKFKYLSKDRDENTPLIFAGGPVITSNPEPYKNFFDFLVIGDGEELIKNVVEICKLNKNKNKKEILKLLSNIEGIYVPNIPCKKVNKFTQKLNECVYTPIISERAFFKNTFIVEISRGCSNCCGFCLASYLNLPFRFTKYDDLIKLIDKSLKMTNKIALLGAQISAHPQFEKICKYIYDKISNGEKIKMSVSSLRVDAVTSDVIKTLVAAGEKSFTLAIEAGSERLRKVINKKLEEKQILNAVKIAKENGLKSIKFYGMIGLPTETQKDIDEMINLAKKIKNENKGFNISFGFSTFVPKAHTPFQWLGRENTKSLERKENYLQKELHKLGIHSSFSSAKWDYWQAVMSRGDESLTKFMIDTYKYGAKLGAFSKAAKQNNLNTDKFAYENYAFSKELPWDFINIQPGKEYLINENKRLLNYTGV